MLLLMFMGALLCARECAHNTMVLRMDLESEVGMGRSSGCVVIWALFRCYSGGREQGEKAACAGALCRG